MLANAMLCAWFQSLFQKIIDSKFCMVQGNIDATSQRESNMLISDDSYLKYMYHFDTK